MSTFAKYLCLVALALLSRLPATAQNVQITKPLPRETLQLPQNLDYELEQLLKRWYEGYEQRSIAAPQNSRLPLAVPNVPDSVYIEMMNRIPSAIRLSYNSVVRETIELYLYRRRPLLSLMLSLSDLYFPEIETELDRHRLPLELKYLTIVESALNPSAISPAGAAGLWQFMLPTARSYGLDINSLVDERMDPVKSTESACKMLKELHNLYKDWWLVMAAYNCGSGNVNRAIKRAGGGHKTFWDIYPYLPKETRKYVPLYIGVYFAMYYANHYGVQPRELGRSVATEYFEVKQSTSFNKIASLTGLSVEQIKAYNPQFRRGIIPWNITPYQIRLPLQAVMKLEGYTAEEIKSNELDVQREGISSGASTSSKIYAPEDVKYIYHKVARRETVDRIAKRYGVSVRDIRSWNGLGRKGLKVGQRIIVGLKPPKEISSRKVEVDTKVVEQVAPNQTPNTMPRAEGVATEPELSKPQIASAERQQEPEEPASNQSSVSGKTHTVRSGETLISIAMRYSTSVAKLKRLNRLETESLTVGQRIVVSEKTSPQEDERPRTQNTRETITTEVKTNKEDKTRQKAKEVAKSKPKTHKVKRGETLSKIAQQHGISVKSLKQWNRLSGDNLRIGQELRVSQ